MEEANAPTYVKIANMSREALEAALLAIVEATYHEGPDTEWSADEIAEVAGVLDQYGLVPTE